MRLLISPLDRTYGGYDPYGVSHTGLQVSSFNIAKVLKNEGLDALSIASTDVEHLRKHIAELKPTHVVLAAFWVPIEEVHKLVDDYPYITFAINCHSNIAFLQSEAAAVTAIRELVDLETTSANFHISGNSRAFVTSMDAAWQAPCAYLPNLYFLDSVDRSHRPRYNGGTLRIGSFGALRPLKNPTVSAFAALEIATNIGADLELYINVGRTDGWGDRTLQAVRAIMKDLPYAQLFEVPWQDWPSHRRLVRHMHLLLQPSFSETFNIVTADGAAEGIPSAVSDVIEWAPAKWQGHPEKSSSIADIGRALLYDGRAGKDGIDALKANNVSGVAAWKEFLGVK